MSLLLGSTSTVARNSGVVGGGGTGAATTAPPAAAASQLSIASAAGLIRSKERELAEISEYRAAMLEAALGEKARGCVCGARWGGVMGTGGGCGRN